LAVAESAMVRPSCKPPDQSHDGSVLAFAVNPLTCRRFICPTTPTLSFSSLRRMAISIVHFHRRTGSPLARGRFNPFIGFRAEVVGCVTN
jgi:hypothetical protein